MLHGVGSVSGKGGGRSRKGGLRENGARQEGAQAGLPDQNGQQQPYYMRSSPHMDIM